jgi:hypothetical protein
MTKKHYIAIAKIFHDAMREDIGAIGRLGIWDGVVKPFADLAQADNPNFDRGRFLDAVDYPQNNW